MLKRLITRIKSIFTNKNKAKEPSEIGEDFIVDVTNYDEYFSENLWIALMAMESIFYKQKGSAVFQLKNKSIHISVEFSPSNYYLSYDYDENETPETDDRLYGFNSLKEAWKEVERLTTDLLTGEDLNAVEMTIAAAKYAQDNNVPFLIEKKKNEDGDEVTVPVGNMGIFIIPTINAIGFNRGVELAVWVLFQSLSDKPYFVPYKKYLSYF